VALVPQAGKSRYLCKGVLPTCIDNILGSHDAADKTGFEVQMASLAFLITLA
jgi:hypothetical protein